MAISSIVIISVFLFISSTLGHSQMRCAKYDVATGNCAAPIRNEGYAFLQEANDFGSGAGGFCQSPMTNPVSASYSNGTGCPDYAPCPDAMGTFTQGETFTIMWLARNHATPDQTPGNIYLYMSPVEASTVGTDVSESVMQTNLLCQAPFISCNGSNGNFVPCWTECVMPANTPIGIHTLWWKWVWDNHPDIYTTCSDVNVVAGSLSSGSSSSSGKPSSSSSGKISSSSTSGQTASTSSKTSTSTSTTGKPSSTSTSGKSSSTSGKSSTSTSGKSSTSSTSTSGKVLPSSSTSSSTSGQPSSSSSSSSGSSACTIGNMRCLTSETYSTCAHNLWGPSQSCTPGTVCTPSGNYIYCE